MNRLGAGVVSVRPQEAFHAAAQQASRQSRNRCGVVEDLRPPEALLRKPGFGWSYAFPGQTYAACCVSGVPRAVTRSRMAALI